MSEEEGWCLPLTQRGLQLPYLRCCGYSGHCVGPSKHTIGGELLINEASAETLETRQPVQATGWYCLRAALILDPFGSERLSRLTEKEAQLVRHRRLKG